MIEDKDFFLFMANYWMSRMWAQNCVDIYNPIQYYWFAKRALYWNEKLDNLTKL